MGFDTIRRGVRGFINNTDNLLSRAFKKNNVLDDIGIMSSKPSRNIAASQAALKKEMNAAMGPGEDVIEARINQLKSRQGEILNSGANDIAADVRAIAAAERQATGFKKIGATHDAIRAGVSSSGQAANVVAAAPVAETSGGILANKWVHRGIGVGVTGFMVTQMSGTKGAQSNDELYNQR